MESYSQFLSRIGSFEHSVLSFDKGRFNVSGGLKAKVNEQNLFRPFYGDTAVFDLDDKSKQKINHIIDTLTANAPECFCDRLGYGTLHMTLHDLSSSENEQDVLAKMNDNQTKLEALLKEAPVGTFEIKMRSKAIFNMVGTSLVLGLYPTDEEQYNKLMALYSLIDKVMTLPYPLTPHITLGYYSFSGFDEAAAARLCSAVNRLNTEPFDITLDTSRLVYQHFKDMNSYKNILFLTAL